MEKKEKTAIFNLEVNAHIYIHRPCFVFIPKRILWCNQITSTETLHTKVTWNEERKKTGEKNTRWNKWWTIAMMNDSHLYVTPTATWYDNNNHNSIRGAHVFIFPLRFFFCCRKKHDIFHFEPRNFSGFVLLSAFDCFRPFRLNLYGRSLVDG